MNLKDKIAEYPNFPKKGILFRDFSPVLKDPSSLSQIADEFAKHFHPKNVDVFAGIESRGFLLATILALRYNKGIIMVRKAGKLPHKIEQITYELEYGEDTLEIHKDAIKPKQNVLIVDDLLATGGTAEATCKLVTKLNGKIIGFAVLIELNFLEGRKRLNQYNVHSLVKY